MDDLELLRNQADNQRTELIEMRAEQRVAAYARVYAATAVAALVLMWFPVYEPVEIDSSGGDPVTLTFAPLIEAVTQGGLLGLITLGTLGGLISLLMTGTFHLRLKTPILPITTAALSSLSFILLLVKFGGTANADHSPTGKALITLLLVVAATTLAHITSFLNQRTGTFATRS